MLSLLVPRHGRAAWLAEWAGEMSAARERGVARGWRGTARMLRGALADALAVRRHGRALAVARGDGNGEAGMGEGWAEWMQSARSLLARPGFVVVAVATLGLGVGAATTMFSTVHAVLLRALPYEEPERVVVLRRGGRDEGTSEVGVSAADARDLAERVRALDEVAVADGIHGLRLVRDGRAESLRAWVVSEGFFEAVRGRAQLGRTFTAEEFRPENEYVVVLAHRTWVARFGADPEVVGRQVVLDDVAHTVVGVLPADFRYPTDADAWTPRPPRPWDEGRRATGPMDAVARLAAGVSLTDAQAEVDRAAAELARLYPRDDGQSEVRLVPLRRHLLGDVTAPLLLLMGAVGLVLLIAAANVTSLQLARGMSRSREFALRGALGASPRRLLRLILRESLLLAGMGALAGVALAHLGVGIVERLGADHLPRVDGIGIDPLVLGFAVAVAAGSALLAGLAPALRASRQDLRASLSEGSRGGTPGARGVGLRDRLVVAEIGVALVLTIGAGLLLRSLDRALSNDPGFDPEARLVFQAWAYDARHESQFGFFEAAATEVAALPGVEAVGLTSDLPFADGAAILSSGRRVSVRVDAGDDGAAPGRVARLVAADTGYAPAMGLAVVRGRNFSGVDRPDADPVALVNETFVRRYLAGRDPVGVSLTPEWRSGRARRIVGVVADVRRAGYESDPEPELYVPLAQEPSNGLTFVTLVDGDPAGLASAVREALWRVDPAQAIWSIRPMVDLVDDWTRERRFQTTLSTAFAALALMLAAVGVYGLTAFSIEQRVAELGVRRALGGGAGDILAAVLGRVARLALAGVALGLVGAGLLTGLLRSMLFGIGPLDPLTFAGLSALVVGAAVAAALVPAARALRIDPNVALGRASS